MPTNPISGYAKAWVALVGTVATALLGVFAADSAAGQILTVVAVIATTVATLAVRNAPTHDAPAAPAGEVEGSH